MVSVFMNQSIYVRHVRHGSQVLKARRFRVYTVDRLMKEKGAVHGPFYRRSEATSTFRGTKGRGLKGLKDASKDVSSTLVKPHELHFIMLWGNTHVVCRAPDDQGPDGYKVIFRGRVGQLTGAYMAKGRRRKRAYGREGLAYWAVKRLIDFEEGRGQLTDPVSVVVKLRGFGQGRSGVVKGLRRGAVEFPGTFAVLKLLEVSSLAHNGCRARKSRRL